MKTKEIICQIEAGEMSLLDGLILINKLKKEAEEEISFIKDFEKSKIEEIEIKAKEYGGRYNGFEIKIVQGRKNFSFNNISEHCKLKEELKKIEEKYKMAYEASQNNVMNVSQDGEVLELPEVFYSSSYVFLKELK